MQLALIFNVDCHHSIVILIFFEQIFNLRRSAIRPLRPHRPFGVMAVAQALMVAAVQTAT